MDSEKQLTIFSAGKKEKQKAQLICDKIITIIQEESNEVLFQAYIMQMLLESFEETYDIDIRHGMSISHEDKYSTNKGA